MPVTIDDVDPITLSAEFTGTGAAASAITIATGSLANSKLANMNNNTIKGNVSGGAAAPSDLTATQVKALLSVDDLITLSGVSEGAANLGTFTGSTIADSQTIKAALQALETALEAVSAAAAHDSLTSGAVTALVSRLGGSATTISTPAAGEYNLSVKAGAHFLGADVFGTNATLNGSNEFILRVDNSLNSRDRRVNVQMYDANTGALVDPHAVGCNWTAVVAGNITTITFPGMNLFGATGYRLVVS